MVTYKFWHLLLAALIAGVLAFVYMTRSIVIPLQDELTITRNTCPEFLVCYEPNGKIIEAQHVLRGTTAAIMWVGDADSPKSSSNRVRHRRGSPYVC